MTALTWLARLLWKPVALMLAILAIYQRGRASAKQQAAERAARDYQDTRRRMDDADIVGDDPAVARDWLRERAKRPGDL